MPASRDPTGAPRRPGRPAVFPATPSALAPALLRWAAVERHDVELVATSGGIEASDGERDEVPIGADPLARMLARAAELASDPHLALRLPALLAFRRFDAGGLAARAADSPKSVFDAIVRYAPLVFPRLVAERKDARGEVALHARIEGAPRGLGYHVDAYVLAFALAHCRRGGAAVTPLRVWVSTSRPAGDLGPLTLALGTEEIEFGAEDTGLVLAANVAESPLPAFDPMLAAAAEHLASLALATVPRPAGGALAPVVSARIEAALPGEVTAETIAQAMRMSSRTLQRRLEDEGARFSVLLDEVRDRSARKLLADPRVSLVEIAARLGFSDLAAFSRAFKRWTGLPPGAFRRTRAKPAPAR
jgi:AraC-like DNA-binding protein